MKVHNLDWVLVVLVGLMVMVCLGALWRTDSSLKAQDDATKRNMFSYPAMVGVVTGIDRTSGWGWNLTLNITGDFYKQHLGQRFHFVPDYYLTMQNATDFNMSRVVGSGIVLQYVADGFGDIREFRSFFFFSQSEATYYNRWANFEG